MTSGPAPGDSSRVGVARSCRSVGRASALIITCGLACSCAGSPSSPSAVAIGVWGGDHVTLTVAETASHLEFDCAHGDIAGAFMIDSRQSFELSGTFVREHGGPVRDGETPDLHPAIYRGSVSGSRMDLIVQLRDTNQIVGTFVLTRGSSGRVVKCL